MNSDRIDNEKKLNIYFVHIKKEMIKNHFIEKKFRNMDRSDVRGVSSKVFNIVVGIVGSTKLYNPIFHFFPHPDVVGLNAVVSSAKDLLSRGKVFISDNFPYIDPRYVTFTMYDFIKNKHTISASDNPYSKNGFTHTPYLKSNWTTVYVVSTCTEKEVMEKGISNGYVTFTRNDAIQLGELISKGKFLPPDEFVSFSSDEESEEEFVSLEEFVSCSSGEDEVFLNALSLDESDEEENNLKQSGNKI